jgi:hypothetical protein
MKKLVAIALCLLVAHVIVSVFGLAEAYALLTYGVGFAAGLAV